MNSKYTGKLVEYLLDKISSLSSGDVGDFIGTGLLDKFLRKDLDERTPHSLASDKKLEVGNFVNGTAGAVIYIDELTKHSVAEIDKLYVRLKAYFEQLEIINVNSVGGKLIVSPAGGIKCSLVETYDSWGYYRCYFLSEQDGEKIENRFAVGDLAYSKTFNAREGSYNKISNRYYWRLVVGRGENYIDLSKTDCDADSDEPQEGDVIVHRGNRNDVDRLNCLEFSSVDSFSPSITLYQGINDYSLADKNIILFGVEKSTGKAFMVVYGDMFIGNRDNSSYIKYSPEKGVEIKGSLDIGTKLGDKTLLDAIDLASTSYEEDLNNLKDIVNRDIENILNLLDGAIETWFYDPAPTLTNLPASLWTTEADKNVHLGDLYYSGAGRAYRFLYDADNSLYYWQEIVDTDIVLALENAKKAQDTADSKRKIFVRKPENSDSYDIGDMWVNANYTDNNVTYKDDLLRAIVTKNAGELFKIEHWTLASKYTDDTVAKDALEKATKAQLTVNTLLSDVTSFKGYVDGAFLDGIIDSSEAQAIEKYINQLNTIKLQVDKSYEEIIKNSILENTTYLTNLNDSYSAFSTSYNELIDTINAAISDNKTTDLEKSAVDSKYSTFNDKYRDYTAYLNLAINYIEETINGKVERALLDIGGYKYLKAALLENTSIEGGLIQSSMLSLGYTKNNLFLVMAGTNGLVLDKGDRTIASWFGGGMIDMFDYYDSNTKTFNVPENVRAAAGLDRMDGTGYRAKGNLWWDEAGVVHADPLSFFVGEATVGGLLASFLVVMKDDGKHPLYLIPQVPFLSLEIADYIRIGDALLKYDSASKAIYVTSADGTTNMGFYASGYVSALGKNSSGGSTGSASALYQLADVAPNTTNDGVLNATNGSVLMYNGSKWQAGNVVSDISTLTFNVNGSKLFDYNGKSAVTANLTVPTKVSQLTNDSGYLTAITKAQVEGVLTGNITSHTHDFASLTSKPTTIGGYGITDGVIAYGTTNDNIDSDWGQSIKTFDPIPSGTPPIQSPNISLLSLGDNFDRRKMLAFPYNDDNIYYRRRTESGFFPWVNLLHSGNYNYYAPSLTGAGASGTWGINITGNAATATALSSVITNDKLPERLRDVSKAYSGRDANTIPSNGFYYCTSNINGLIDASVLQIASANSSWRHQLMFKYQGTVGTGAGYDGKDLWTRLYNGNSNTWTDWYRILTSGNYNSYVPTLTGSGASGTWGINISGNAATATNADMLDGYHWTSFPTAGVYDNGSFSNFYDRSFIGSIYAPAASSPTGVQNWFNTIQIAHRNGESDGSSYISQIAIGMTAYKDCMWFRGSRAESWTSVITSANIGSQSVNYATSAGNANTVGGITCSMVNATAENTGYWGNLGYGSYRKLSLGSSYGDIAWRAENYCVDLMFGANIDTHGFISIGFQSPVVSFAGSNNSNASNDNPNWYFKLTGTSQTTYNLNCAPNATKLATSRTIWGQSFDGTANVDGAFTQNISHTTGYSNNAFFGASSATAGAIINITFGKAKSNCNLGYIGHVHKGDGLDTNYVTIGGYAKDQLLNILYNGNVGIGTTSPSVKLHVIGDIAATGAITAKASSSDIRLKTDITDYKALSIIRGHKSIKYHWNEAAKANADIFNDDDWHYGLIAQDVQKDMPQMVSDVFKDYLVINYERLIPICWKGLQEVDDEVTKLKKKVRKLEMEIRELKQKEDRL